MKTYKYMSISMKIKKFVTELLKMYVTRNIAIQIWKSWQFLTIWYKIPKFWHFPWNFAIFSKSWQFLTILTVWTPWLIKHMFEFAAIYRFTKNVNMHQKEFYSYILIYMNICRHTCLQYVCMWQKYNVWVIQSYICKENLGCWLDFILVYHFLLTEFCPLPELWHICVDNFILIGIL